MKPWLNIRDWWLSLKITDKFGTVFLLLLVIVVLESLISITALQIVNKMAGVARTSIEMQRLSLEMSRDWEIMKNFESRFFSEFSEMEFSKAKELYAIPAGEKLSDIIRSGAFLHRMTLAEGASVNLRENDPVFLNFLSDINQYATYLANAMDLASKVDENNNEKIQEILVNLQRLEGSIEPNFTLFILMSQNEVNRIRTESENTQKMVNCLLIVFNTVGIGFGLSIFVVFRRNIFESVAKLTNASKQMQKGHLNERVQLTTKDEFGLIATSFNQMASAIQERTNALQEIDFRYQALFNQSNDAVLLIGLHGEILNANQRALLMYGYSLDEMTGRNIQEFTPENNQDKTINALHVLQSGEGLPVFENTICRKDGTLLPVEVNITQVNDENGKALYFQSVSRDISGRKETETQLRKMAMFDSLTGLSNRTNLYGRFSRFVENAIQNHRMIAVLYLDLDGFKQVNDKFGHEQGDLVLAKIGELLKSMTRNSDLAARVGGDEFVVILENISKPEFAGMIAQKINSALTIPIKIEDAEITLSTSLGISLYPVDGEDLDSLIKKADKAMYQIKSNKKNGYQFFNSDLF